MTQSLVTSPVSPNAIAAPPNGPPLAEIQLGYLQQQLQLWGRMLASGAAAEPVVAPDRGDRRFNAEAWRDNPGYSFLKQSYLLNSRLLSELVEAADLDPPTKHRVRFYTRQFIDAMSPANYAATNPDVIKAANDTKGQSLQAGMQNLLADLRKGGLTITDENAFEIGKNVAVSAGSVIFENELFQLIQYAPLTDKVASRPLVIVPPCIKG
jgi:polyhydroxyalkanoate synthase